jgi:hypothetical protein
VRRHNAQAANNQQSLKRQINALKGRPVETRYINIETSTNNLYDHFEQVERQRSRSETHEQIVVLAEQESRNSLSVMDALIGGQDDSESQEPEEDSGIIESLKSLSDDLCNRWQGAVFALHPNNPDAARHFCTSVREVFTEILEIMAPDGDVTLALPDCFRTQQGKPTRRSKIIYLLRRKGVVSDEIEDFVEADINNVVELFTVFNEATHGKAGRHDFGTLKKIKKRVEGGIMFLASIAA